MEHRTPRQDKVLAGFRVSGVSKFGGFHESERFMVTAAMATIPMPKDQLTPVFLARKMATPWAFKKGSRHDGKTLDFGGQRIAGQGF